MFKLFLNCLFHFSKNVLNEKEPENICTIYNENINTIAMSGKESDANSENTIYKTIDSNNKLFLQKYFNFSHGGDTIIQGEYFWGIRVPDYLSNNEKALELVEIIMNSNYFNGIVDKTVCYVLQIVFFCYFN